MSACTLDGVRTVIDRNTTSVTWRCPWCGGISTETHDPVKAGLMSEYEPRRHP